MITEAGGLIGNFTGEADYPTSEVVAGNPKVYAQLVQILALHQGHQGRQARGGPRRPPQVTPEQALAAGVAAPAAAKKRASAHPQAD